MPINVLPIKNRVIGINPIKPIASVKKPGINRRIIYDLHADGGLPPLLLDPVNFAKLYQQKKDVKDESIN